jgi:hypothetical protein
MQHTQSWEGECSAVVESSLGHQAAIRASASSSRQAYGEEHRATEIAAWQCHEIAIGLVKHIAGNAPVEHVNEKVPL